MSSRGAGSRGIGLLEIYTELFQVLTIHPILRDAAGIGLMRFGIIIGAFQMRARSAGAKGPRSFVPGHVV